MVKQGKRYQATIRLSFVQSWFGNDAVAGKFEQVGFTEVKVTGSSRDRLGMAAPRRKRRRAARDYFG
jgi:hypothetical protein